MNFFIFLAYSLLKYQQKPKKPTSSKFTVSSRWEPSYSYSYISTHVDDDFSFSFRIIFFLSSDVCLAFAVAFGCSHLWRKSTRISDVRQKLEREKKLRMRLFCSLRCEKTYINLEDWKRLRTPQILLIRQISFWNCENCAFQHIEFYYLRK